MKWSRFEMDLPESTKVVYNRIQKLEPENVSKILGYILLQENAERDMIRLAFSPDNLLHSWINKAKSDLGLSTSQAVSAPISPQVNPAPAPDLPFQFVPFVPTSSGAFSSPANFRATNLYFDPQINVDQQAVGNVEFVPPSYADPVANLHGQLQFLSLEDQLDPVNSVASDFAGNYYYPEQPALGPRANRRTPSLPEFPVKVCHYFIKGFCKHGTNCRYFHGHPMTENFSQMFNASSNELANDDHTFSPGSLEKLELEITELLRSRRGCPVSIASLPMLYYEKYGRTLQAEGYLTESQRHGKAGYSLTKLLARLNNSIRLIDRPHGQHSVILAEDVRKYMDFNGERSDHGAMVAGSRQIYLTFPAESTFTEQDVSNYFNKYGPVQDVRIPCQQKRMFGFVTFVFAETVKQVLMKGNPHFVCGARVLVKPYREKSKLVDRKYVDKIPHPMFYASHFAGPESEVHSVPRGFAASMPFSKQLMEEHQALEAEGRHLSVLQMAPKAVNQEQYIGNPLNELNLSEDQEQTEFPSPEHFNYLLDVLNSGSTTDEKLRNVKTRYNDQDSQGLNLPDSPFAPAVGTSISTVT
ncbi:zinc finger CCCH domain-containing protein 18 isoform X2 [Diospyros lotus]|uniref:zinc finger CCCH domain-containing protein 18 isoform X2 n=1 Tax=Diospyros lotus TaxID=55363 RepID=UPI00224EA327|nr:zinc finger CCCH domain-containing protein 18 isoform X2 [Diospyros lotus]